MSETQAFLENLAYRLAKMADHLRGMGLQMEADSLFADSEKASNLAAQQGRVTNGE